jgi:PcfJ-like protein
MNVEVLNKHISSLGLKSISDYKNWCLSNGFTSSLNKNPERLYQEEKHAKIQRVMTTLKKSNKKRNFKDVINQITNNDFDEKNADEPFKTIYNISKKMIDKKLFLHVIMQLKEKTKLLDQVKNPYIVPIAKIVVREDQWIRPFDDWEPKSYNHERQFSSLVRHLFAKYEVPLFFDSVWFKITCNWDSLDDEEDWFIHVGSGQNIFTAYNFIKRFPMTKKMVHFFMQAPDHYSLKQAWWYGQIRALGGQPRLVDIIRETKMNNVSLTEHEFCLSMIRFFIANPMLDLAQVSPIIDYIWHQKYESHRDFIERGRLGTVKPPQPNFSMTGRTVESLLIQVNRWHRQLGKEKGVPTSWDHSKDINDFEMKEGKKCWSINELLSSKELANEGRQMKHCVASYAQSCARGATSIWSMSVDSDGIFEKLVTIEVRRNEVSQVRGKNNRFVMPKELAIINRWATKENLKVSNYIQ